MRKLLLFAPLLLAGCGEGATDAKKEDGAPVNGIAAGLWEVTSEVTSFALAPNDPGPPAIDTPEGTSSTETVCVGEGERPPSEMLSGPGYSCTYSNYYLRNGRVNVTMDCTRQGLSGNIAITLDGRAQAESFEVTRRLTTYLSGDGDVRIESRLTGRRAGDCPAEGAEGGANAQ